MTLHQWINRLNAYYGERWQRAGSFEGRMVRARVLLRRDELDGAAVELDLAGEVLSNYPPHHQQLADARGELDRRRAQEE